MRRRLLRVWALLPHPVQTRLGWLLHPKRSVTVCALILVEQESVLLAEHPYKRPRWLAPGGCVGRGEQPTDCLRREIDEELGLQVTRWRLVHLEQVRLQITLYYQAECQGTFRPSAEIARLRAVPLADLPPDLPHGQRVALAQIQAGRTVGDWQVAPAEEGRHSPVPLPPREAVPWSSPRAPGR